MSATQKVVTFRSVRNVSEYNRPMSVWDAFFYNFLTMGVIFPWTYLWGPASFPGADIKYAIFIALLAQLPISLAYCCLATVLPIGGGDYVYQRFAFGKWGFISVMSGFVIWILQWVALSGWLFATLGLAPLLLSLGVYLDSPTLSQWGVAVQSAWGVFTVSILLALATTLFLIRGMRLYVQVQRILFVLTLLAISAMLYVFSTDTNVFVRHLNDFVRTLVSQLHLTVPSGLSHDFFTFLQDDVRAKGFDLSPSFSWLATLGIVPIAWTSLQWATYSVEQNTEIARADHFRSQVFILVGSAVAVAVILILVAHYEHETATAPFVLAASAAYWAEKASPETLMIVKTVLQPFPNILAMAAGGSVVLAVVIALGFLANAFQVTCNCFIGVTRILVAMGQDGLLPGGERGGGIDEVDPLRHAPVKAHWVYFAFSIPVIAAYSFIAEWKTYSLGVTFACGYVFMLSALAATQIPTKMKSLWLTSQVRRFPPWLFRMFGWSGFLLAGSMVAAYLLVPQLGITGTVPYSIVAFVIMAAYALYVYAKSRSPDIDDRFEVEPAEIESFYRTEPREVERTGG